MSGMRHATISAWKREEDGSYAAELHGWALHVRWHAETAKSPRGFTWEARPEIGAKLASDELFEEIEVAMAQAEEQVEAHSAPAAAVPSDAGAHH